MTEDLPLVTVIVSSYNRPVLLRDAVESVLRQTWPNIELIVTDDLSDQQGVWDFLDPLIALNILTVTQPLVSEVEVGTAMHRHPGRGDPAVDRCALCINAALRLAWPLPCASCPTMTW